MAVKPTDDPELPINTVRAWCIGFVTCTVVTACNVLLSLRRSPVTISPTVVQLIAYPMGKGWHATVPNKKFRLFGHDVELNPETPFNMKVRSWSRCPWGRERKEKEGEGGAVVDVVGVAC